MVSKGRRPNKVIADTLKALDIDRFEVIEVHKAHRWGALRCRTCGRNVPVYSTPRVPEDNARLIIHFTDQHIRLHTRGKEL